MVARMAARARAGGGGGSLRSGLSRVRSFVFQKPDQHSPPQPRPVGADRVCGVGCLATGIEPGARPADREISRGP